nr:MAG TPA: hypothetical protein [Bacteriophage sp.]
MFLSLIYFLSKNFSAKIFSEIFFNVVFPLIYKTTLKIFARLFRWVEKIFSRENFLFFDKVGRGGYKEKCRKKF